MAGDLQRASGAKAATCGFCEEQHAFLYCKADAARLCLECDRHVHTANPLALKHARAPLCECCGERTATLQCEQEAQFFCAACEQVAHVGEGHTLIKVVPFRGYVSSAQLASAWRSHARASPVHDIFLPSKNATLDKPWWTSDGSLSSILASTSWTSSLDSFFLSASKSYSADQSGSYSGGECVRRKAFLKQLEQLQRLQYEGDDTSAGLQQESFQECMSLSPEQFDVPYVTVEAQTYADVEPQQEVSAKHESSFITSCPLQTQPSVIGSWNYNTERKISETKAVTGHDTYRQSNEAHRRLLVDNTKELSSWIVPPSSLELSMENTNLRSEEQIFPAPQPYIQNIDTSRPSVPERAGVHSCSNSSPREATESFSFNEDGPVPCVKLFNSEIQLKPNHGRGYSLISNGPLATDCGSTPPSLETEASAKARGSAMMRYKEKKKTRNFEKFVRYESRKARAENRLRVRGRFVKANGFTYESLLADGID